MMGYLDKLQKNIFMCTEEDYCDLMRFFQKNRQFWVDNTVLHFPRWKWMFFANPNAPYPCIWVFKKNNKILAHQASIPFLLKVGNEYYRSAWAAKVMVDPDYQNRGIGSLLTEKWTADVDVPVALGMRDGAYKMYTRAGWIDLGKMACFVKLLDAGYIIQRRMPISTVAQVISMIANFYLKLRDDVRFARGQRVNAEKVSRFDKSIDELWDRVSVYYDVIAKRDSMYLNWKYTDDANIPYTLFQFSCDDGVVGYAILMTGKENGILTGHIVDFLAEPYYIKSVIEQILYYFRSQKAQKVYLRILCNRLETVLRKAGFCRRGEWVRMMVKQKDKVPALVGDASKWFITPGDGDLIDGEMHDTFGLEANWRQ